MKCLPLLFALFAVPLAVVAQIRDSGSVCLDPVAAGNILTICYHEHGMAPQPQPRLHLRVFKDGRAEYESLSPYEKSATSTLIKKTFRLTEKEVAELLALGRASDFQKAEADYPRFHIWDDSWLETTLTFDAGPAAKTITLRNFMTGTPDNKAHYPASLITMMERAEQLRERALGIVREVPTVDLCTLIKFRDMYLGQKVTTTANIESGESVLASLKVVDHGETLTEPDCSPEWRRDLAAYLPLAVVYPADHADELKAEAIRIREAPFDGRARVSVTGILREDPYRFEIIKFNQSPQRIILPYRGSLDLGWTYSDTIDYLPARGLQLSSPLAVPYRHTARIEWTNLAKFAPILTRKGRRYITFRTSGSTIAKIDASRWDSVYMCESLEITKGEK